MVAELIRRAVPAADVRRGTDAHGKQSRPGPSLTGGPGRTAPLADVAQLEERHVANVKATGSSPVVRFNTCPHEQRGVGLALAGAPQCSRPRCTTTAATHGLCDPHYEQVIDEVRDVER